MACAAHLNPETAQFRACTVSRDVQQFDLLIEDMEAELGEAWGDLGFEKALAYFSQPEADALEFVALAVDAEDEGNLAQIAEVVSAAHDGNLPVILVAAQVNPAMLHELLRLGADALLPYPLPEGALSEAVSRLASGEAADEGAPSEAIAQADDPQELAPQPPATAPDELSLRIKPAPAPEAPKPAAKAESSGADLAAAALRDALPPPKPSLRSHGRHDGVIIPVHGLAGGVGSTTMAVNLAWELATLSKTDAPKVCILDLDFQFGSVATYLDLPRRDQVFDILSDVANVDSEAFLHAMQTVKDKLYVFTAPADMLPLDFIGPEELSHLLDLARANFDFVICDLPKSIVAWTETMLSMAHVYFAQIELDMRSAQNALRLVRALKAESLPHEKLRFALNRAPGFTDLSGKTRVKRLAESLSINLELMLPDGGKAVTQANDHGLPLAETASKNALRKEFQKIAKQLYDVNKSAIVARA